MRRRPVHGATVDHAFTVGDGYQAVCLHSGRLALFLAIPLDAEDDGPSIARALAYLGRWHPRVKPICDADHVMEHDRSKETP